MEATVETKKPTQQDVTELVTQYLLDHELYNSTFFPETCRQRSAAFHQEIDNALWGGHRKVGIKVFRDGAKTSRVRMFMSKRIAYGISRTILYISKGESYAEATISWLKHQVENNTKWAVFYGIVKGSTWTATEIEVINVPLGIKIYVKAVGIHGQVRGFNVLDYRPDLIVCDDIEDEKTVNTSEQIAKHTALLFGSVMRSLASPVDNPDAMIVIIQTPLDSQDAIESAFRDPTWFCVAASCFVVDKEGKYVLDANGNIQSSWPDKWPVDYLLAEKESYISRNILSLWLKEMEVTVTSPETCAFQQEWLQYYDVLPADFDELVVSIDPASSELSTADFHVTGLVGKKNNNALIIGYDSNRGIDIEQSTAKFFDWLQMARRLANRKTNIRVGCEITGYQRQLKRAIDKEMAKRGDYAYIEPINDKRSKVDRITQAIRPVASNRALYCNKAHTKFIEQYSRYPQVPHDDEIDQVAIAVDMLNLSGAGGVLISGGVERIAATASVIARSAERQIGAHSMRRLLGHLRG